MKYLDFDLGSLSGGEAVAVTLRGVESDVMLMSAADVHSFAAGGRYSYRGGHYRQSPVRLAVPAAGAWHVVVVPTGGRVEACVTVLPRRGRALVA